MRTILNINLFIDSKHLIRNPTMPITFISSAAHTKRLTAQWSFKHSAVMAALLMACCSAQAQNARMDEDQASDDAIELKTTYVRPE